MADSSDVGIHEAREFGRDVEAETRRVGAEGDAGGGVELVLGEFLIDVHWQTWAEIADDDTDGLNIV